MEPFWFFRLRFRRAYDSACDSDFRFSLGRKRSYDSDYDSDSSENQPLPCTTGAWALGEREVRQDARDGRKSSNNRLSTGTLFLFFALREFSRFALGVALKLNAQAPVVQATGYELFSKQTHRRGPKQLQTLEFCTSHKWTPLVLPTH